MRAFTLILCSLKVPNFPKQENIATRYSICPSKSHSTKNRLRFGIANVITFFQFSSKNQKKYF